MKQVTYVEPGLLNDWHGSRARLARFSWFLTDQF